MVALSVPEAVPARPARRRRSTGASWLRWVVLVLTGLYFLVPLYAALDFAVQTPDGPSLQVFGGIPGQAGFLDAFGLSLTLALVTTVITLVLMVPTAIYVHLRLPRVQRLFEGITILPIVIPPVVLIVGVLQVAPGELKGTPMLLALVYAVLAMPFAYRSLDSGLRALSLTTLVEASRSLGAGWTTTLFRVLLPNLRSALLSATVLTVALVLGEYTMASLDQYETFPVWVVVFDQDNAHVSVAVSLLALIGTWILLLLISLIDRRRRSPNSGES
ncbi:ABC transporter permease subunit [Pseudonocardia ailaonensis]|uniref:ABC transporter permease subunit n=1 Tax=Pseudonocardia ailaonensis TaxID=367279 RepID=A0ABN2N5V6_9PSEU